MRRGPGLERKRWALSHSHHVSPHNRGDFTHLLLRRGTDRPGGCSGTRPRLPGQEGALGLPACPVPLHRALCSLRSWLPEQCRLTGSFPGREPASSSICFRPLPPRCRPKGRQKEERGKCGNGGNHITRLTPALAAPLSLCRELWFSFLLASRHLPVQNLHPAIRCPWPRALH